VDKYDERSCSGDVKVIRVAPLGGADRYGAARDSCPGPVPVDPGSHLVDGCPRMEAFEKGRGERVTAAFRGLFLLVGVSAIVVVVFLIVTSAV
jgi:hypothetical protein